MSRLNSLSPVQSMLLSAILSSAYGLRTDVLSQVIGRAPREVPPHLLPLREEGLLTTTNDGGAYVVWAATSLLREMVSVAEADARRREQEKQTQLKAELLARQEERKKMEGKFILWSPQSKLPPKVIIAGQEEAEKVAAEMSAKHAPQEFYVCRLVSKFKQKTEVVRTKSIIKEQV